MRRRRRKRTPAIVATPDVHTLHPQPGKEIVDVHMLRDGHGYEEPVADAEEMADEDPMTAHDRARAAADAEPKAEPSPQKPPQLSVDMVIALLERMWTAGVENHARRRGVPLTDELRDIGKMNDLERQLITLTAPAALANVARFEALLAKYGHIVFAVTVGIGTAARYRLVNAIARDLEAQRKAAADEPWPKSNAGTFDGGKP